MRIVILFVPASFPHSPPPRRTVSCLSGMVAHVPAPGAHLGTPESTSSLVRFPRSAARSPWWPAVEQCQQFERW